VSDAGAAVLVVGEILLDVVVQLTSGGLPVAAAALGGSAPTIARAVGASGLPTALVGRVGCDGAGSGLLADLQATGVTLAVRRDPALPTGRCVVLLPPPAAAGGDEPPADAGEGPPRVLVEPGAAGVLRVGDVPAGLLAGSRHLHVSGYLLAHGGSRVAARRLMQRARAAGLSVSVQCPRPRPLARLGADRFLSLADDVGLLVVAAPEAFALTGVAEPEAAARLLLHTAHEVVVTDGSRGAVRAARDGPPVHGRAGWLTPVPLGMQGAGDAFTGGYLVPWLFGGSAARCLAAGAAAARARIASYRPPGTPIRAPVGAPVASPAAGPAGTRPPTAPRSAAPRRAGGRGGGAGRAAPARPECP
jgi:sugar/nucleoside kinase (ribokinase family)